VFSVQYLCLTLRAWGDSPQVLRRSRTRLSGALTNRDYYGVGEDPYGIQPDGSVARLSGGCSRVAPAGAALYPQLIIFCGRNRRNLRRVERQYRWDADKGAALRLPTYQECPIEPLLDPVWNALETVHAHFAVGSGPARRYPAEVTPFGALADASWATLAEFEELLEPGERIYVFGSQPETTNGLSIGPPLQCHQILGPLHPSRDRHRQNGSTTADLRRCQRDGRPYHPGFPGFFRQRTCEMGTYYGIRVDGELVAMAGERLAIPGYREISGVCTHSAQTGKGYAKRLMTCLMREHANAGLRSFLHVSERNTRASALYERLGFSIARSVSLWPVSLAS
jgi:ribosomal protein S18 acetylase RimI-like enzyme